MNKQEQKLLKILEDIKEASGGGGVGTTGPAGADGAQGPQGAAGETGPERADAWVYVFLENDALNSTTSSIDTLLTFTPLANKRYEIEMRFFMQSSRTTAGVQIGLKWPTGVKQNIAWLTSSNSATTSSDRFWGNTVTARVAALSVEIANEGVWGGGSAVMVMDDSVSGEFIVTVASESTSSQARIMANSFIRYREI
jgi:hypothetical protein